MPTGKWLTGIQESGVRTQLDIRQKFTEESLRMIV